MKDKFFIPGNYVPVSEFFLSGSELRIPLTLLDFVRERQQQIRVAYWDGFNTELLKPDKMDLEQGTIGLSYKKSGIFTVVLDTLINDFPVVTHWNAQLNNNRGGFCLGAADGVGKLDIDLNTDTVINEKPIYDKNLESPYTFLSDKYMFFSGKSLNLKVPGYERYIGENYSLFQVTDALALWLSVKTLKDTGYPVIYKNYPQFELQENIPAFQVVSNFIIASNKETPSLATFILPPYWQAGKQNKYPVLFSGFYDSNENMFQTIGPSVLKVIGNVMKKTSKAVIGVIWNGGGSIGARTFQYSAFHNLSELFRTAAKEFSGDPGSIVAVGGSRGGITALIAAGNSYHNNYRIKYAVCYNPIVRFGENDWEVPNPTCPLVYAAISEDTGYKLAWMRSWRDPVYGLSGQKLFLNNLFGTCDRSIANEVLCPCSKQFAKTIAEKGTKVFLAVGTHDAFATKDGIIDFAELLISCGVQVHLQFGYRFGHNNATNLYDTAEDFLCDIILGKEKKLSGISHYRRISKDAAEWEKSEQFFPERQPAFFEGPKKAALGDKAVINIVGAAGMAYILKLYKIDDLAWIEQKQAIIVDEGRILFEGVLNEKTQHLEGISYFKSMIEFDGSYVEGFYLYEFCHTQGDTMKWVKVPFENVPQPGVETYPVLELLKHYPAVSGLEMAKMQDVKAIGWGLSDV
ncbi:MAG TPA: hypothetical protein GXX36_09775 [Clostridiaceae bacterium]|nr:hypothetical protein [Clostridiaceae bacterium]